MKFVDASGLRQVMTEREHSCRTVAHLTKALEQMDPARYRSASHGLVGALAAGTTRSCHDLRAAAIERAVSVPAGALFADRAVKCQFDSSRIPA